MDTPSIFPCWGRHERMGHNHVVGRFEAFAGTAVLCTIPEIPGDENHGALPGARHVLPMDGPAFYGFTVLPEEDAMALLAMKRPRIWHEPKRLVGPVEDAVEVPHDDDDADYLPPTVCRQCRMHRDDCECDEPDTATIGRELVKALSDDAAPTPATDAGLDAAGIHPRNCNCERCLPF